MFLFATCSIIVPLFLICLNNMYFSLLVDIQGKYSDSDMGVCTGESLLHNQLQLKIFKKEMSWW